MKLKIISVLLLCCGLISCSRNNIDPVSGLPTNTIQVKATTVVPSVTATETPTLESSPTATVVRPTLTPSPTATLVLPTTTPELSAEAYAYLAEALNIMEANSIDKYILDWAAVRSQALQLADGAITPADTYPTIQYLLNKQGNGHSFFMKPAEAEAYAAGSFSGWENAAPLGKLMDEKFGYILIPGFAGMDAVANDFATEIQRVVQEIDQHKPCAWIVDLRQNRGGNMWPMLAGIGPILGEGCFGSFVDPDGAEVPWCYENGVAYEGDEITTEVNGSAYEIIDQELPVAVLIGNSTASSGEAVAVAFQGRPRTQSFGFSTAGYTTANEIFEMSDGAWIVLTVSTYADRNGQIYDEKIIPDVKIMLNDEFPREVEKWLSEQPLCQVDR